MAHSLRPDCRGFSFLGWRCGCGWQDLLEGARENEGKELRQEEGADDLNEDVEVVEDERLHLVALRAVRGADAPPPVARPVHLPPTWDMGDVHEEGPKKKKV